MKTKLKHFINVPTNHSESLGRSTEYMFWSPVHHSWFDYPREWDTLPAKQKKFLLKQPVVLVGLRNSDPDKIALFLKDYGKEINRKKHKALFKIKYKRRR